MVRFLVERVFFFLREGFISSFFNDQGKHLFLAFYHADIYRPLPKPKVARFLARSLLRSPPWKQNQNKRQTSLQYQYICQLLYVYSLFVFKNLKFKL